MLEITRKAIPLDPQEVMEVERIIMDEDHEGASRKDNVLSFMSFMLFMVSSSPSFFSSFTCVLARESLSFQTLPTCWQTRTH